MWKNISLPYRCISLNILIALWTNMDSVYFRHIINLLTTWPEQSTNRKSSSANLSPFVHLHFHVHFNILFGWLCWLSLQKMYNACKVNVSWCAHFNVTDVNFAVMRVSWTLLFFIAGIPKCSGIYAKLEKLVGPHHFIMYGDLAYPLKALLMKPYGGSSLTATQLAFNNSMSRVRLLSGALERLLLNSPF